jgi:enoyl-CoA hydratase/carnithine racemase
MADNISVSVQDRVLTVRMNRPEKKNALTRAMYQAMMEALRQAGSDPAVRVVMITGSEDCFTAGNDIADFANAKPGEPAVALQYLETLAAAEKPVVAAVGGVAVGIGTTMLLHCDLVYSTSSARFQLPFVNLGLCPEAGSSFILPSLLGQRRAAELLFFGDAFGADEALHAGIVNEVCVENELFVRANAAAQQLAEKPPTALRTAKLLLKQSFAENIKAAMARETKQFAGLLQAPEAREAMTAFLQRRKPDFSKF